jgi:hypothetical protein
MRIARTVIFALVVLALVGASTASAQQPYIGVFFNKIGAPEQVDCQGVGVLDSLFFIGYNFNISVVGAEFRVLYPPELTHVADVSFPGSPIQSPGFPPAGVTIGSTPNGVSTGWALPQNGFFPLFIGIAIVQWNCEAICLNTNVPIQIVGHPLFAPDPQFTDWPLIGLNSAIGLTGLICQTVPVEETTWGRVKSLFSE